MIIRVHTEAQCFSVYLFGITKGALWHKDREMERRQGLGRIESRFPMADLKYCLTNLRNWCSYTMTCRVLGLK